MPRPLDDTASARDAVAHPLERGRNLGPVSAWELRAAGIRDLEALRTWGFDRAFRAWVTQVPERAHRTAARALQGACLDVDWRLLPPAPRAAADRLADRLRAAQDREGWERESRDPSGE